MTIVSVYIGKFFNSDFFSHRYKIIMESTLFFFFENIDKVASAGHFDLVFFLLLLF